MSGRLSLGNYVYNEVISGANYNRLYSTFHYLQNSTKALDETQFQTGLQTSYSDYFVENASFFRMDNMSLGYRFSNIMDGKLKLHLNATVQNAFVVTKYSGLDPEINGGIDNNVFPRTRVFILGINCEF